MYRRKITNPDKLHNEEENKIHKQSRIKCGTRIYFFVLHNLLYV